MTTEPWWDAIVWGEGGCKVIGDIIHVETTGHVSSDSSARLNWHGQLFCTSNIGDTLVEISHTSGDFNRWLPGFIGYSGTRISVVGPVMCTLKSLWRWFWGIARLKTTGPHTRSCGSQCQNYTKLVLSSLSKVLILLSLPACFGCLLLPEKLPQYSVA